MLSIEDYPNYPNYANGNNTITTVDLFTKITIMSAAQQIGTTLVCAYKCYVYAATWESARSLKEIFNYYHPKTY